MATSSTGQSFTAQFIESNSGGSFLSFDAAEFGDDVDIAFLEDFMLCNGVWWVDGGHAVFYPASEHPNVVRGYN